MPYTQEHKCVIRICQKLRRTSFIEGKKGVILYFFAKNISTTSQGFMYRGRYFIEGITDVGPLSQRDHSSKV